MKKQYAIIAIAGMLLACCQLEPALARGSGGTAAAGSGAGVGTMNTYQHQYQYQYEYGSANANTQSGECYARDSDLDGITNGNDDDYEPPQDGTGFGTTEFRGADDGVRLFDEEGPHGKRLKSAD